MNMNTHHQPTSESLRPQLEDVCDTLDAAIFTGDVIYNDAERKELRAYVERWLRAIEKEDAAQAADAQAANGAATPAIEQGTGALSQADAAANFHWLIEHSSLVCIWKRDPAGSANKTEKQKRELAQAITHYRLAHAKAAGNDQSV